MGIITKEVQVKLWGKTVKFYNDLGYEGKHGDVITVKVEDLSDGSNAKIQYLCDYCQKEVVTMVYADYIRRTKEVNKMACKNCYPQKIKEVSLIRYGTVSYSKTEQCKEKKKNTIKSRYGVEHYSQTQEYKDKWNNTCTERYGESYRKQFMDKAFETFRNKTGYEYPSQSPEVRKKTIQSYIDNFGYEYSLQSPKIRDKISKTLYANSSQKASKQQRYINNLYQGVLNYPVKYYNVDIYLPNDDIVVEYDGGFHLGNVIAGRETIEEHTQKEIIRSNIIKREGYKIMRIISTKDFLPSDQILLQMLSKAKQYFSKYPNHSWVEFDIDSSTIRNAENKDGISYNYGKLRKIKDSNLCESVI